jgi:hypothetical protein
VQASAHLQIIYEDGYEEIIVLAEQRIQLQVFPGKDPVLERADVESGSKVALGTSKKKRKREQSEEGESEVPILELGPNGLPCEGEIVWGKVKGGLSPWLC